MSPNSFPIAANGPPAGNADAVSLLEGENAKLRARITELERLVATDTLTPVFNQRHFHDTLERWCWRAHRYGTGFGLLFLDIDRMKAVNDIQGHGIGDDVLRGVASALLGAVRKSDIVARVGGDEFAVLLDTITPEQLDMKTASMRKAFSALPIKTAGPTLDIGVSIGSSAINGKARAADVLSAADAAMYAHKRSKYPA
jgi:diguanylate cyclase (GGDEF)-like protein